MSAACINDWRELASRSGDGLEVSLLWSKTANQVRVAVHDERLAECFQLDVANAEALAAFHHPFAYAAFRPSVSDQTRSAQTGRERVFPRLG